jgi:hypothetical protein
VASSTTPHRRLGNADCGGKISLPDHYHKHLFFKRFLLCAKYFIALGLPAQRIGALSFDQVGALGLPLIYSGLLDTTGSYGIGFIVCGVPALLVGVKLLRQSKVAKF